MPSTYERLLLINVQVFINDKTTIHIYNDKCFNIILKNSISMRNLKQTWCCLIPHLGHLASAKSGNSCLFKFNSASTHSRSEQKSSCATSRLYIFRRRNWSLLLYWSDQWNRVRNAAAETIPIFVWFTSVAVYRMESFGESDVKRLLTLNDYGRK